MYSGLYASASSLLNGQRSVDLIAGNLANINVPGYKEARPVFRSFPDILLRTSAARDQNPATLGRVGGGSSLDHVFTSFEGGPLTPTGNRDDLAISGNGFFQVLTDRGVRLTRNGSFLRDPDGVLRNAENEPVLGRNGIVSIPDPVYVVKEDGRVFGVRENREVREEYLIDQLDVVDVSDESVLIREGDSHFSLPEGREDLLVPADGEVRQGCLERANLTLVDAMVRMIDAFRAYEMSQRMLRAIDETLDKVVNDVAATV